MLSFVLWTAGITLGVGIVGQVYAWIWNRPNPVLDLCGCILEGLADVAGDIDFDGD